MIEHTQILKQLFAGETVTFAGEHYSIAGLDLVAAPHRPAGPPILIGGGARRVLTFAGATADIVGVNASIHSGEIDVAAGRDAMPERIDEKVEWVRAGAGDRFDDSRSTRGWRSPRSPTTPQPSPTESRRSSRPMPTTLLSSPLVLIGSVAEIEARLHERRERWGYSYHVIPGDRARDFAPVVKSLAST